MTYNDCSWAVSHLENVCVREKKTCVRTVVTTIITGYNDNSHDYNVFHNNDNTYDNSKQL